MAEATVQAVIIAPTSVPKILATPMVQPTAVDYFQLASYYLDQGDFERAIQNLDEAIRLDPQYIWAYYNRDGAHFWIGQYERASGELSW